MQEIHGSELPADHPYFRSASPVYRRYLELCGLKTFIIPGTNTHGWIKNVLWLFNVVKMERVPVPADIDFLRTQGFRRGIILWVPACTDVIPDGWRKFFMRSHFQATGFTRIDGPDFRKKWNDRAKRSLKKFQKTENACIRSATPDEFIEAFKKTRVRHMFKSDFITYYRKMRALSPDDMQTWVCVYNDKIVAGLATFDYCGNNTMHFAAFTGKAAKAIQGGTALIDRWFQDSFDRGVKYVNFDHLRDPSMTRDQQGYTDFKKNFMEYWVNYPDSYFKWFW